ncbi:hypothetical protein P3X46_029467 [Hevea brasiliensis]|uniref:N-acetyltransferase domain-containing protein n=1 Tax=Hevea brasiliensis TaxID=3981 RepID=A0ABQ9KST7_HEVBR|nr:hypothetical protein P3X46_029467 [Hevea brasiliensis]
MLLRVTISHPLRSLYLKTPLGLCRYDPTATTIANKYSISDKDLESRGFVLHRTISNLNLDHLNCLYGSQKPVTFAMATGDNVFNAIIWDVVVYPLYQGIGLGKDVLERLVQELLKKGIANIALYSEPRVLGFYKPLGFVADPDGIRGMVYSRKQKKKKITYDS